MRTKYLLPAAAILWVACATVPQQDSATAFIRGTARVVSVDQTLGHVLLVYQNQQIDAYWQTELDYAQNGTTASSDSPFRPPVGVYKPPNTKTQEFEGKPGDTIEFIGMRTGRSLFLRSVAVVSH